MRKALLFPLIVTATALLAGCGRTVTIKGHIDGLGDHIYIYDETETSMDTILVKDGRFSYTRKYPGPTLCVVEGDIGMEDYFRVNVFIEPGTIKIQTDTTAWPKDYVYNYLVDFRAATATSGTPANNGYLALRRDYSAILDKAGEETLSEETQSELHEMVMRHYEANKDNYFGAYLLNKIKYYYSGHELNAELETFPEELQDTRLVKRMKELAERMCRSDVGEHYMEVVQNDPSGNPVSLSSVVENPKNKYVLLDFWASWCRPCLPEFPFQVKAYEEFHEKGFEIYGVSFDEGEKWWKASIEANNLSWIHVSDLKKFNNQAGDDYGVHAIPMNFLIETSTGTIIARNLRNAAIYETVAGLFENN